MGDAATLVPRIEQYYEAILALWNQLYINMKSLVSWHYCMIDIEKIRAMTIAKVCTTSGPGSRRCSCVTRVCPLSETHSVSQISTGFGAGLALPSWVQYFRSPVQTAPNALLAELVGNHLSATPQFGSAEP